MDLQDGNKYFDFQRDDNLFEIQHFVKIKGIKISNSPASITQSPARSGGSKARKSLSAAFEDQEISTISNSSVKFENQTAGGQGGGATPEVSLTLINSSFPDQNGPNMVVNSNTLNNNVNNTNSSNSSVVSVAPASTTRSVLSFFK